jgi:hypothetical protein
MVTTKPLASSLGICLLLVPVSASATAATGTALSPRVASYSIAVTLDPSTQQLAGEQVLYWRNLSPDTIETLPFHLYLNAFRNERSSFLREDRRSTRSLEPGEEGWIDLTSVTTTGGVDLTSAISFIRPDDGNEEDSTVVEIPLPHPVLPGDSLTLSMRFRARLPRIRARTGYAGDFFMVAQWFPKIGVYEAAGVRGRTRGGWNCHQFHRATEFYADFGVYTVSITIPERFVVGATGVQIAEASAGDSLTTLTFRAEDVHDFAWTASPDFVVVPAQWKGVDIRILMQQQHLTQASRYREAAVTSLRYLDAHLGPYPYPSLTIVDPAFRAPGAGGMEYPTLITTGTFWGMPEGARIPEEVTVHEFTHQYWYGMVASNEVEEAWLDEGLTTYYTGRIMDETYGATTSFIDLPGLRAGRGERIRTGYTQMRDPRCAPIAATTWEVANPEFGRIIYYKTATMLATLERMIGQSAMDSVMRAFFLRWRFRHPSGADLVATFNELVVRLRPDRYAAGLGWFFDQILDDTVTCDYEVQDLASAPAERPETRALPGAHPDTTQDERLYTSTVTVRQRGQARIPASIRVSFEDGSELIEQWDGRSASVVLHYTRSARAVSAEVDPERVVLLDLNLINNSRTTRPSDLPAWSVATRLALVLQTTIQLLAFLW